MTIESLVVKNKEFKDLIHETSGKIFTQRGRKYIPLSALCF